MSSKKLQKKLNLAFFAVAGVSITALVSQVLMVPSIKVGNLVAERPEEPSDRVVKEMVHYLEKSGDPHVVAATREKMENTPLAGAVKARDPEQIQASVHAVIDQFWALRQDQVQDRIGLIRQVADWREAAVSPVYKDFLLDLVEKYNEADDPNLKALSTSAHAAYIYAEADPDLRASFLERYPTGRKPARVSDAEE